MVPGAVGGHADAPSADALPDASRGSPREDAMSEELDPVSNLAKELGTLAARSELPPRETMLAMFHAMVGLLTVGTQIPEAVAIRQLKNMINKYEVEMGKDRAKQN
jgi:hypothetical protein